MSTRLFILAAITSLLLATPAQAVYQGPQPLHFDQLTNSEKQDPIEQQTPWVRPPDCTLRCPFPDDHAQWVTNPTSCWWDVDDHRTLYAADDYLNAGASVQVSDCQIAETDSLYQTKYGQTAWWSNAPRPLGVQISAPSASLTVTACYQPQGRCFGLPAVYNAALRTYSYNGCIGVSYQDGTTLPTIADSNGGIGILTTRTVTITNPTNKTVRQISGQIAQVGWGSSDAGCTYTSTYPHNEYPFHWT